MNNIEALHRASRLPSCLQLSYARPLPFWRSWDFRLNLFLERSSGLSSSGFGGERVHQMASDILHKKQNTGNITLHYFATNEGYRPRGRHLSMLKQLDVIIPDCTAMFDHSEISPSSSSNRLLSRFTSSALWALVMLTCPDTLTWTVFYPPCMLLSLPRGSTTHTHTQWVGLHVINFELTFWVFFVFVSFSGSRLIEALMFVFCVFFPLCDSNTCENGSSLFSPVSEWCLLFISVFPLPLFSCFLPSICLYMF